VRLIASTLVVLAGLPAIATAMAAPVDATAASAACMAATSDPPPSHHAPPGAKPASPPQVNVAVACSSVMASVAEAPASSTPAPPAPKPRADDKPCDQCELAKAQRDELVLARWERIVTHAFGLVFAAALVAAALLLAWQLFARQDRTRDPKYPADGPGPARPKRSPEREIARERAEFGVTSHWGGFGGSGSGWSLSEGAATFAAMVCFAACGVAIVCGVMIVPGAASSAGTKAEPPASRASEAAK